MKTNILFTTVIAFAFSVICAAAPQKESVFRGKVLDASTDEPVGWATVALMTTDSTFVAGTSCDENGNYEIRSAQGDYSLCVSLIGYEDATLKVTLTSDTTIPPIRLNPDVRMIQGASVTERVKLVEIKIDKVVMNVKESAFAQGSNALELIKKAPGVTIDKDGNVKLNGKSVAVWIDGRPSYLDGKSLEALLRSTGSESIDKFEMMEHPSSKYDASGQGGIINIKTRRNLMQGFNGSVGLGGGGMHFSEIGESPLQQSAWVNLAYRTKATNTFLNVYESSSGVPIKLINETTIENIGLRQYGESIMVGSDRNLNFKIGTDWFINDKNTIGIIASIPSQRGTFDTKSSFNEQYLNDVLTQTATSEIYNGPSSSLRESVNLNYTHIFDPARSAEITSNVDFFHNKSKDSNGQTDTTFLTSAPTVPVLTSKSMLSDNIYDIYSAKTDYQTVLFKKFMFEAGAKWALSVTDNTSMEVFNLTMEVPQDFIYREHVGAAYASLAGQLSPKLSFKAGLRGEYTNSLGDWKSSATRTNRDYFDLFPTVFLGYQLSEKWSTNVSYARRITRPSYSILNPAKVYVDAKTYTVGNPDILPQYSSDFSLQAIYGQHLSFAIAYNHTSDDINQIPTFNSDGSQYLTWGNLGRRDMGILGFNVSALPVTKWLQWTFNSYALYMNSSTGTATNSTRTGLTAQLYTDLAFTLPHDWRVDLDGYYVSPMVFGCFYVHQSWSTNIAAKKSFLDNKLSLSLKLDDIFRSFRGDVEIIDDSDSGVKSFLRQKYYSQALRVDLTWTFGNTQRPTRHRNVGNLEEMSRMSSGSGSGIGK